MRFERGGRWGYGSLILASGLAQGRLSSCLAKMGPFPWRTVSAVKMAFSLSPFWNTRKRIINFVYIGEWNGILVSKQALSCSLTQNMFFCPHSVAGALVNARLDIIYLSCVYY